MKSQTASEVMEFKVAPDARLRIKRTALPTRHENIGPGAFVPKIDIQIGKIQDPMRANAKINSASGRPSATDSPVVVGKLVRELSPYRRGLMDRCYLANFGQADRPAAGAKYHYPVTQGMSDTHTPGAVPIQADL